MHYKNFWCRQTTLAKSFLAIEAKYQLINKGTIGWKQIHQSSVSRRTRGMTDNVGRDVYSDETIVLGDIIMLADAFDINMDRARTINIITDEGENEQKEFEYNVNEFVEKLIFEYTDNNRFDVLTCSNAWEYNNFSKAREF